MIADAEVWVDDLALFGLNVRQNDWISIPQRLSQISPTINLKNSIRYIYSYITYSPEQFCQIDKVACHLG